MKVTWMSRPPSGRGRAGILAPWAWAIAWTMARPSPCPSAWRSRSLPTCWNGWKSRSISAVGIIGPVLLTVMVARPGADVVETSTRPSCDVVAHCVVDEVRHQPLDEYWGRRLRGRQRGWCRSGCPRRSASCLRPTRTVSAMLARSNGSHSSDASLAGRESEECVDEPFLLLAERERLFAGRAKAVGVGVRDRRGQPASSVRCPASGVRSSWEAFATKWRWASKDGFEPPEEVVEGLAEFGELVVGPSSSRRRCRFVAEISRAVVVMVRSGRRNRPAIHQADRQRDRLRRRATITRGADLEVAEAGRSGSCAPTPLDLPASSLAGRAGRWRRGPPRQQAMNRPA